MIIWIILFESQGWKRQNADAVRAFSSISQFLPPHCYSLSSYFTSPLSPFTLTVGKSKFTRNLMTDNEKSQFSQGYSHFKGHHLMTNTKYWISNDKTWDSVRQRRRKRGTEKWGETDVQRVGCQCLLQMEDKEMLKPRWKLREAQSWRKTVIWEDKNRSGEKPQEMK